MTVFVKKGEVVTCENGHPLYRIIRDVQIGERIQADQFERIDDMAADPSPHAVMEHCPHCGGWWAGFPPDADLGTLLVHFEDGWR